MANPVLEQIRAQKQEPMPTAPVGMAINWFEANETDRCYAAVVTKVEGPAKLKIIVFKPDSMPTHKTGVLHRSHPIHKDRHCVATMKNGSWDYLPGQNPLKSHRELHLQELERREAGIVEQERQFQEAAKVAAAR